MERYTVVIKRQADKKLKQMPVKERTRIAEKIYFLGTNPNSKNLDTKPLDGTDYWRLRVVDWRIIYAKEDELKIISIEKIKPRGDAYK